jgi:hypothetical protein
MHTYFDLLSIEIILLAAVLVCKASKKDRSVTEAMTDDDVDLVSRTQYKRSKIVRLKATDNEVSF